jgi:hypothetical protein
MSSVPSDDELAGRRLAWVDQALHWSHAARRALTKPEGFIDVQLGFVALTVAVTNAVRFLDGLDEHIRGDSAGQADCPIPHRELRRIASRLDGFRDEILHLHDKVGGGRHVEVRYAADPPGLTLTSTIGRKSVRLDSISRGEALALLDVLNPWLGRHRDRLVAMRYPDDGLTLEGDEELPLI